MERKPANTMLSIAATLLLLAAAFAAQKFLNAYVLRILNLCAIYAILGVSMNLINGLPANFRSATPDSWRLARM